MRVACLASSTNPQLYPNSRRLGLIIATATTTIISTTTTTTTIITAITTASALRLSDAQQPFAGSDGWRRTGRAARLPRTGSSGRPVTLKTFPIGVLVRRPLATVPVTRRLRAWSLVHTQTTPLRLNPGQAGSQAVQPGDVYPYIV